MLKEHLTKKLEEQSYRITRNIVAEKAGISPAYFSQIITGRVKNPGVYTIEKMAKALNCSIDELIGRKIQVPNYAPKLHQRTEVNLDLAESSLAAALAALDEIKQDVDFSALLEIASAIYKYSLGRGADSADLYFANWFAQYFLDSKKD